VELRRGRVLVMKRRMVSAITLTLLLTSMLTLAFHIQLVKAEGTIYIRADGSIDPPTAQTQFSGHPAKWNKTYGGPGWDYGRSVVQTSDGGYAIVGFTLLVGSDLDAWLFKTDAGGNVLWNKTYGGPSNDRAHSVVQTSDGGYALAGYTYSFSTGGALDFWLIKTDSAGNIVWSHTYGGAGHDCAYSMVQTSDGGYALAGETGSYGAGDGDFYLVKTDTDGTMQWNMTYGGTDYDCANSMVQTDDGGYALAGQTNSFGGTYDFWLVKTDANGDLLWNKTYRDPAGGNRANCVIQTSDGGYALTGLQSYVGQFVLVKTDASGNVEWNQTYGGPFGEEAFSVIQTSDRGYALAGETFSFGAGESDFWLVKTDSAGNMQWNQTYGGPGRDRAYSVVQTSDGEYALAGETFSFGAGYLDFWLVKTWSHNVAVVGVTPSKTVVGQGYCMNITVAIENQGGFTETLNVTTYANEIVIATLTDLALTSGSSTAFAFTWNTTGFSYGNYSISAYATILPEETNATDNSCTDGTVHVGIPGDVDPADGYVGIDDIFNIALRFGTEPGGPPNSNGYYYSPVHDINDDLYIGIDDLFIAASHFGEENP
jgi:hypothetical protein